MAKTGGPQNLLNQVNLDRPIYHTYKPKENDMNLLVQNFAYDGKNITYSSHDIKCTKQ
jgi:hypothetical protein